MKNPVLTMKGIEKQFVGVKAVDKVDLELFEGEILAIVGENGAGKSTLMKILSGSYPATSYRGEIAIGGKPVHFVSTKDSESAGIEMIYQEISLHLDLSVSENIFLGNLPVKRSGLIDWQRMKEESEKILGVVGLEIDPSITPRNLSTSQQQLVSIVKALIRNPKILVLDEPTSALTETEVINLLELIRDLKSKGISCIYISHKLEEVFSIADRIMVLRDGKCVSEHRAEAFTPREIVEDMVGRDISSMYPKEIIPLGDEVLRADGLQVPSPYTSKKNIIENVSFSLHSGEILGIGGLVGSGRSELVNAIFGNYPLGSGELYIHGERAEIGSPIDAIKHKIGLLTEDRRVNGYIGTMSVRHNITLASYEKIFGKLFVKKDIEKSYALEYVNKLNVKTRGIEENIRTLSGGNQQKVVLAKWLLTDVRILILDEPTRGIDVGAKYEIYTIIEKLAKQGVAIIMISSELPELLAMCDNFIILYNGRVQRSMSKDEVTKEKYMAAATGVDRA
jgi:ABC-type sugar transport system ATPase subunit